MGKECRHERVEIAGRHALRCGSNHVTWRDCPCHRSGISGTVWAKRGSYRTVTQVCTEPHHDTARHMLLAEVYVRLRDWCAQAGIGQVEGDCAGVCIEVQIKRACAHGKDRPRLIRSE